jgi:flavin-dependent dehydrogenase
MERTTDILIAGGGLAGLASGIHLAKKGFPVTIIEKEAYPRHKVCGEYISNEILPYLDWLGADISALHPIDIHRFEFSALSEKKISAPLPLGGKGISRHALDNYLYETALKQGCIVVHDTVTDICFNTDLFTVNTTTANYTAKVVLGAYGKRSPIDQVMERQFIQKKSPWLAIKAHYKGEFDENTVALHNFAGGYCGVSKTEKGMLNICYLADYATFKQYKNIEEYQKEVLYKNKWLKDIFSNSTMVFERPLAISQISFDRKAPVEHHILMTGDTAGLIHPLCGNGMAMAVHSAKIASELIIAFIRGDISRDEMEERYSKAWRKNFNRRMTMGRLLSKILAKPYLNNCLFRLLVLFPSLLRVIIKQTHGKPLNIAAYGN